MGIWGSVLNLTLGVIEQVESIGERIGDGLETYVAPHIRNVAEKIDDLFDGQNSDFSNEVRRKALVVDGHYQRFMINRIDPLFGQTRTAQLEEMGSLQISPKEIDLNRKIALSAGVLLATTIGKALLPITLLVSVPISTLLVLPIFRAARDGVKKQRRVTYHLVAAVNLTAVWLSGLYVPAIGAITFYYFGEKLLMVTEDRSHKGIVSVFSKMPRTVWVRRDGIEQEVPFEEIAGGDVVVIDAGGVIPVDGTIAEGVASIDQHALTGEAQPAEKAAGDTVYASTVVLAGKIQVRVDKAGRETVAAQIVDVLNQTASYQLALQSRGRKIADDAALPTLIGGALALPLGIEPAIAMLSSAFGTSVRVSAPVTMLNLFNIASTNGILMKDGRSLELMADVDTVLFDKTGTLTISQPNVAALHCADGFSEQEVLTLAAAAEFRQTHPIALAILAEAKTRGLVLPDIDDARYDVGYGIKVIISEKTIQVGSERYMNMTGTAMPPAISEQLREAQKKGHSMVMVAVDGLLAGAIELQPTIRPEAEQVIAALRKRGLSLVIISGDQEEPTRRLAERLGMDRYFANVLPAGKADLVAQLQAEGKGVCFVGDGINDSIALKKANVSVSLRGATTVATDSAQVVLMQESLEKLPFLFDLSDDMERSLRWGTNAGTIPGFINVAGVFLFGTGYPFSIMLNIASLAAGMVIAVYPTYKYAARAKADSLMVTAKPVLESNAAGGAFVETATAAPPRLAAASAAAAS